MVEKYYLISGKALANVNFRISKNWYKAGENFESERISERDLNKYRRFFSLQNSDIKEIVDTNAIEDKPLPKKENKQKVRTESSTNESLI